MATNGGLSLWRDRCLWSQRPYFQAPISDPLLASEISFVYSPWGFEVARESLWMSGVLLFCASRPRIDHGV